MWNNVHSGQIRMKQYKKFKLFFPDQVRRCVCVRAWSTFRSLCKGATIQAQYGDITTEQVAAMTAEAKVCCAAVTLLLWVTADHAIMCPSCRPSNRN